jgi:type II secretory pathway pseudopilin PulG
MQCTSPHARHDPESGYMLLAVIFLTVVVLITLAIAAPKIATEIQRDKDVETIHRGEQYRRAIQLYYRTFGAYPATIDQLLSTNNIRYLRKRYTDPETGKDDWKPVIYGQAHVRPLGFFGQPLGAVGGVAAAAVVGGASTGMYAFSSTTITTDENGLPVASDSGNGTGSAPGTPGGSDSGFGNSSSGFGSSSNSGFGSGSSGFGSSGSGSSGFGSSGSGSSGFGSSGSGFGSGSGSSFGSSSGLGQSDSGFGSSGAGQSGFQSGGSTTGGASSGFGSSSSTSGSGSTGSPIGSAGPIVGFTLPVNKPSLVAYKLQTRYNKWEFNYDPIADQMMAATSLFGGSPTDSSTTGTGTTSGFGGTTGGTSSGLGGTTGGLGGTSSGFGGTGSNLGSTNNQNSNPNGSGGSNTPQ